MGSGGETGEEWEGWRPAGSQAVRAAETAAQRAARLKQEFRDDLVKQFESDGNVQELVERFSASVEKSSITPVKKNG